ncbi:hypothetical protein SteCoe_35637 [Stentor coeruleus]|uniref:Uncharacterized protein n=1 Tax=Stentor coeruleus TaxID=5963 RepID=A0A1R2ARZ0_9CILI|nr:hypothetical protein SteCoe_35637 [Stentor coeruleus]
MDYLDNKLEPLDKKHEEPIKNQRYYRGLFKVLATAVGIRYAVGLLSVRNDPVRKALLGKRFYGLWFPVVMAGFVVYPIDNKLWQWTNSQMSFWQNLVFSNE